MRLVHLFSPVASRTVWCLLPLLLAACSSSPLAPARSEHAPAHPVKRTENAKGMPVSPPAGSGRGGYYLDDGPGENIPPNLTDIPDAEPRVEPYIKGPNKPYSVFGKAYAPLTDATTPFKQRGTGTWYGKKFNGQKTASGEFYDMYKMTAAHPTLPLPSYARVTNLKTGAQVIVRVNDRGPFHSSRIIDLSYTAALKLGYIGSGSSQLEVERILPEEITRMAAARQAGQPAAVVTGPVEVSGPSSATALPPAESQMQAIAASAAQDAASASAPGLASGFYLQFGAYSQEANAQTARAALMKSLWDLVPSLEAVQVNGLYRLFAGPYISRAAAQEATQLVLQRTNTTAFIIEK
jgi:rare lipoprotein A